ncbi:VC0807 family protein [Nonomuraea sp. LP-02]|uniref:VC0807 family protein n=1 Tax=Nonomuraea sp. LP-02 TaxID=3097960 RepID=UPI002E346E6F|nr:VC0807 family protein [Nonomuraea sp. LP-02]MED7926720.1 VC0807 family protein [Nonomuraea sp. LP-02]
MTLPRLGALAREAAPKLLEAVVAPLAVFYLAMVVLGFKWALIATVAWVYLGVAWRLVRRVKVPATMFLAAFAITVRALVSFWTGTWMWFFIQPELGTICISMAFLASVRLNRPLVQKLTLDYIHLPSAVLKHERIRRFFARITLLWAFVLLMNSTLSIALAVYESLGGSLGAFMILRTSAVAVISGLAIAFSIWAFKRVLRRLHVAHA